MKIITLFFFLTATLTHSFALGMFDLPEQTNIHTISISEFVNENGTFQIPANFNGAINLLGFDVYLDESKGIIATPQTLHKKGIEINTPKTLLSNWSTLPALNSSCMALAVFQGDLYAGGFFTIAGGVQVNGIAKWDGSNWSAIGGGLQGNCFALAASIDALYVGGSFDRAGGLFVRNIAKWDGSNWSALGDGVRGVDGDCYALAISGNDVYAGGAFRFAGSGTLVNNIAKWDGSNWSALRVGTSAECRGLAVSGNGDLYATGGFSQAGSITVNAIAKWDGSNWSALGSGLNRRGWSITFVGNDLYVGGEFTMAGGITANRIAKWDGNSWSALGSGLNSPCYAMFNAGGYLYAGGDFSIAGGVFVSSIARWDGLNWAALDGGVAGGPRIRSLAVRGTEIFIGGSFSSIGGIPAGNIAVYSDPLLPVQLLEFKGQVNEDAILLFWQTANELNNERFEIQRSQDGIHWKPIGSLSGKGTTTQTQQYKYTDTQPLIGNNFYRLKQIDFDGRYEYSDIVTVKFKGAHQKVGNFFPNPSLPGKVKLKFHSEKNKNLQLTVFDETGKKLFNQFHQLVKGSNFLSLNFDSLSPGIYFVQMESESQSIYRTLIIE